MNDNVHAIHPAMIRAVALLLRFHGIAVDDQKLAHEIGADATLDAVIRFIKRSSLRCRRITAASARLHRTPLPAIARSKDGEAFILAKATSEQALIQNPVTGETRLMALAQLDQLWDGTLILVTRRALPGPITGRFDISWFFGAVLKYRKIFIEVIAASFFLQIFALISPLFFQVVVDKVLVHRSLTTLDVLVAGLLAVAIFETLLTALRTYTFSHTTSRIDVELGARLFHHLIALPVPYFEARRTGDSVARVRELENIRNFLTSSSLTLAIDLFFTLVFIIVMAIYSLPLTVIVLLSLPLYFGISAIATPLFRHRLDEKFSRGAENQAFLVETVTGIETLKAMAVEPQMQRRWEEQLAGYVTASFRVLNLSNISSQSVQFVSKVATAAILYFGARAVIDGAMTVGELVAFNMLASRVAQPVLRLAQVWQDFHQTKISIERLADILNTPTEPPSTSKSAPPQLAGAIVFDHVDFRYRPNLPNVLQNLSFSIQAGQVIGIVGSSGSGKSTIAKLIQRFQVAQSGRVLVDGMDLAMIDTAWLRRQIGVVLQDNVLFNRTVRENIALADPGMPMPRVIEAARLAGAHDFILELPEGYDTQIGERGVGLSGGQRQRIAIARALVTNPRLLILDEATSALDYESEQAIQSNMRQIVKGRTVIIIAHRLSAVRDCDRILTLEKGRLIEDGTHDELMRNGGRYASLVRLQQGGNHGS